MVPGTQVVVMVIIIMMIILPMILAILAMIIIIVGIVGGVTVQKHISYWVSFPLPRKSRERPISQMGSVGI